MEGISLKKLILYAGKLLIQENSIYQPGELVKRIDIIFWNGRYDFYYNEHGT